jgi:alkylhydroperoxidase/carboxymuconolactone decarboxylase family protein YurZ
MTTTTLVEQPRMDIAGAAPDLYRDLVALGGDLRLDPGLRQLVNLRASILNGCAYCIDMHAKEAAGPVSASSASTRSQPGGKRRSSTSENAPRWRSPTPSP